jgi:hypothetical protein
MLYQLADYDTEEIQDFFDEDDETTNALWESIKENQINSKNRYEMAKKGGEAKASKSKAKSKAKSTKSTKTTKTKKKSVKSNPPNPDTVIQPEEIDEIINIDINDDIPDIDNFEYEPDISSFYDEPEDVDEPEVTEDVAVLAKPKDKDLSKSEVVSLICLNLEIASEMAIEIYNYRVLKKVSNSTESIEKFCNEINANVKKYKKTQSLFVENYVAGKWLEFIKKLEEDMDDSNKNKLPTSESLKIYIDNIKKMAKRKDDIEEKEKNGEKITEDDRDFLNCYSEKSKEERRKMDERDNC